MKKLTYAIVLNLAVVILLWSQETTVTVLSKQEVPSAGKIIDLFVDNNQCYLFSQDSIVYNVIINSSAAPIIKDNINFIEFKLKNIIHKDLDFSKYQYIFAYDTIIFACIQEGWSSRIIKINSVTGKGKFLTYIYGIPSGLIANNNKIWYLFNKSNVKENGIIKCYDMNTGIEIFDIEIPVLDAKGISMTEDGIMLSYENQTNTIYFFKIVEE